MVVVLCVCMHAGLWVVFSRYNFLLWFTSTIYVPSITYFLKINVIFFLQRSPGGARKRRVDRGSVPAPVGSMVTAGADRSAAEIAVELSHVQNLRLDGRRIKNLLYIHRLSNNWFHLIVTALQDILKDVNSDVQLRPRSAQDML